MVLAPPGSPVELGGFGSSFGWRIFPPPAARPRRTKKKSKKQQQSNKGVRDRNNGNDPDESQRRKELWQQKQQQYQYTYPYRVGDPVIIMLPQEQLSETQEDIQGPITDREAHSNNHKKQKLSAATTEKEIASTTSEKCNTNRDEKCQNPSSLVPVPGTVFRVNSNDNEGSGSLVNIVCKTSKNKAFHFSPKEQRKCLCPDLTTSLSKTCSIVLVEETLPFRKLVKFQLHNQHPKTKDRVLEIGCSTGELSKIIWKNHSSSWGVAHEPATTSGPSWIGMDHSQEMIEKCQTQLARHTSEMGQDQPNFRYATKVVKVDALAEPKRALREATTPTEFFGPCPTVVLIDIGGNRECGPVVQTIAWVMEAFGENCGDGDLRMIIVKSRALVRQLLSDGETNNTNSNDTGDFPKINASSGAISNGNGWFEATRRRLLHAKQNRFQQRFKHPLKAPMVLSPIDGSTPICRYHNYHKDGCKLYNDRSNPVTTTVFCPFDHDHCHACLQRGHVAQNCPKLKTQSCY